MLLSSMCSLLLYAFAWIIYVSTPSQTFTDSSSLLLWLLIMLALLGALAGNIRSITLSTIVTILIPEETRAKANGLVGTTNGIAFLAASIFSGLAVGFLGLFWVFAFASGLTALVIIYLWIVAIPDQEGLHAEAHSDMVDIRGTIRVIHLVRGLFGLIFFQTFTNFGCGPTPISSPTCFAAPILTCAQR
jgi:MFS transporter, DHA3 family, multidrug efflux protein